MGIFDGKVFDLFRDDEGDAAAAQNRADKHSAKADSNQAIADNKLGIDEVDVPGEAEAVVAPLVQTGPQTAVANVGASPQWGRMVRATKKLAEMQKAQEQRISQLQAENAEITSALAARQVKMGKGLTKLVETLREQDKKRAGSALFLSDGVMSALSGFISVINVSDQVQSPTFAALGASLQALIASDVIEGPMETWLRTAQLISEALAYYDAQAGLTSIIGAESGSFLTGSGSTSSTWLTDSGF